MKNRRFVLDDTGKFIKSLVAIGQMQYMTKVLYFGDVYIICILVGHE